MPHLLEPGRRRPRLLAAAAGMLAVGSVLAACSPSTPESADAAETTLVVVTPDQAVNWALDAGTLNGSLQQNTQATLIRKPYVQSEASKAFQQDIYSFEGYLADSYDVSEDGLTYTFHLHEGVLSHAGNELTADDVLWSYERKFATPTSMVRGLSNPILTDPQAQIAKIDDYTVSFTLADVSGSFTLLSLLSDLSGQIYDSDLLIENATPEDPYAVAWSAENPNYGFGAYEVESYEPGVETVLVANDDWVLGEPAIDRIVSRIISDAGQRVNAVRSGEADIAEVLPQADLAELTTEESVFVPEVDNPNKFASMGMVTNKAPFDDPLVRQAMAYAVPYDDIIENVYYGRAVRNSPGILSPDTPFYEQDEVTPFYDYDPERSLELLEEAGITEPVEFTLVANASAPDYQEVAIQIQTAARAAGFEITLDVQPAASFIEGVTGHTYQSFIHQAYAVTMSPPYELLVYTTPDSINNRGDWTNQEFLDAVNAGIAAGDPLGEEAGAQWTEAMKIYVDQVPLNFLVRIQPDLAMSADVEGFAWRTDNIVDYSNLSIGS